MNKLFSLGIFSKFNKESALSVFFPKVIAKNMIFFCIYCSMLLLPTICIMEKLDCSCFVETIVNAKIFLCSETLIFEQAYGVLYFC